MPEHTFVGISSSDWSAVGTVIGGVASLINLAVVVYLAKFTKRSFEALKSQTDASIEQAKAATASLDLVLTARRESEQYQEITFQREISQLTASLEAWIKTLKDDFYVDHPDMPQVSDEWDVCLAFMSRKSKQTVNEMHTFEATLNDLVRGLTYLVENQLPSWTMIRSERKDYINQVHTLCASLDRFRRRILPSEY